MLRQWYVLHPWNKLSHRRRFALGQTSKWESASQRQRESSWLADFLNRRVKKWHPFRAHCFPIMANHTTTRFLAVYSSKWRFPSKGLCITASKQPSFYPPLHMILWLNALRSFPGGWPPDSWGCRWGSCLLWQEQAVAERSLWLPSDRFWDVNVGIDVFGRRTMGGGRMIDWFCVSLISGLK